MGRVRTGRTIGAASVACALALAAAPGAHAATDGSDLTFEQHHVEVSETAGRASVTIRRATTAALEESEATYATYERTATEGDDFGDGSGRVRLAVGQTSSTITVYLLDDTDDEPDETFVLRMFRGMSSEVVDEAIITIHDDDHSSGSEPALDAAAVTEASQTRAATRPSGPTPLPLASARPYVRPASPARVRRAQPQPVAPRVTPFEIRSPARPTGESLPVPDHTTPVAAAGLLAALALARVSAETWYRWRAQEL